ncbi:MAG TPA: hypothetical protein DCX79_18775 [Planctomycetaceae bacterium]|nr:hypothetical protein [Planctomycetaceae bacterium]
MKKALHWQGLFSLTVFGQDQRFWWTIAVVIRQNVQWRMASNRSSVVQVYVGTTQEHLIQ